MDDTVEERVGERRGAMLRANARAQAEARGKIKALDLEIEKLSREGQIRSRVRAIRDWGRKRPWKIQVKAPNTPEANGAALGVACACERCGFRVVGSNDFEGEAGSGVYIESGMDTAQVALLVQGSFQIAGLDATLLIHEFGMHDSLTIHLRRGGL